MLFLVIGYYYKVMEFNLLLYMKFGDIYEIFLFSDLRRYNIYLVVYNV